MKTTYIALIVLIDVFILGYMLQFAWNGNDKSVLISLVYYPVLIAFHLLIAIVLRIFKLPNAKPFWISAAILALLFFPFLILASLR